MKKSYLNTKKCAVFGAVFSALTFASLPTMASMNDSKGIESLAKEAQSILQGKVMKIDYKDSVEGIPHTFVTYQIEDDLQGLQKGRQVTLRFIGGIKKISDTQYDVLEVSNVPEFNLGEENILMLAEKDDGQCPLVRCSEGFFKVKSGEVFTESGRPVQLGQSAEHSQRPVAMDDQQGEIAGKTMPAQAQAKGASVKQFKKAVQSMMKGKPAKEIKSANMAQRFSAAIPVAMPAPAVPARAKQSAQDIMNDVDHQ
ncbi:hypothetical protein [Kangiella koreensis]|uniref:Uncharacterized protein n=1 Tax=Kangiella koreensis (strain DSM 16069 / JCM 12317 / KCTC 12182 / SW-125) TaxID=523791 RepID=C7R823_KANKD|nr:hypothetical protein [Kangiella koreensis]ACV25805.1 hypothetical protein Kkor_0385 [Kangiella koreensis DSM 16069]